MRQAELLLHHQTPVYLYQFSYSGVAGKILGKDSAVPGKKHVKLLVHWMYKQKILTN